MKVYIYQDDLFPIYLIKHVKPNNDPPKNMPCVDVDGITLAKWEQTLHAFFDIQEEIDILIANNSMEGCGNDPAETILRKQQWSFVPRRLP